MSKILMLRPNYFDVIYDINPWMTNQRGKVDNTAAFCQWHSLRDSIIHNGGEVVVMNGIENLPDAVFTANAGAVYNNIAVLSRFAKSQREGEELHFRQWFESQGYTVVQPINHYEGEGDHLCDSEGKHWVGTGFRTSKLAVSELEMFLDTHINILEMIDPRWYHLDTCFCPLPNGELLWYPAAFTKRSQKLIRKHFAITIDITEEDALAFACNTLCIDNHVFMPKNNEAHLKVRELGYITHLLEMSEFMRAGGAVKCLTLDLHQSK